MTECEMCGWNGDLVRANVEGTILRVCKKCSVLGAKMEEAKTEQKPLSLARKMEISEFVPDFAEKIRHARESAGMNKSDLARRIGVSPSLLSRIEKGMRPTDALARKLEKELKIGLFYTDTLTTVKAERTPEVTLGDVVELRIRKK
ncbi:MAG: TIGR00270 family protein [Candidatus Aenigmarchaeota archaeon]|nr:TIGR00270 family protein [Candidatus Aenigmarchaeota archaeon]